MADRASTSERTRSLKSALQKWIDANGLAEDTIWVSARDGETEPRPDLELVFEGDLHSVLWCRAFESHDASHSGRLREEFNAIVRHHGFRFDFKDEVTGYFYDRDERQDSRKSRDQRS